MLVKAGAQVDEAGLDGTAPLHQAEDKGHAEVARVLIESGVNVDSRRVDRATAMYTAA